MCVRICLFPPHGDRQDQLGKAWMSWAKLRLHCKHHRHPTSPPPPCLWASQGLSIPLHRITVATALPSPPHQSPGQSQLPDLTASSSASQQLPNNARPDNRLPCRLQVCQPRACQITVSVNSGGGGGARERERREEEVRVDGGKEWRAQGGACWVGRQSHTCTPVWVHELTHTHTHAHV